MKTIIAAFRDSDSAETAAAELRSADLETRSLRVIEHSDGGADLVRTLHSRGVPEQRSQAYANVLHRGAALIIADADDKHANQIASFLDDHGSLDLEDASSGWMAGTASSGLGTTGMGPAGIGENVESRRESTLAEADPLGRERERENVAVVQEEVKVGKRDVGRGGVRVRTFVTETPVSEQVNLHEERVDVRREPVGEPVPIEATNEAFSEDEFIVTAKGQEPVVEKQAKVVERVHVEKEAETRTENIEEAERRRDVEVEQLPSSEPRRL